MTLSEKVSAVEKVFEALDQEISEFQKTSTLFCKAGCGKCCFKADIEATVLEFLPFAQYLYKNGKAIEWLEQMKASDSPLCPILNPTQVGAGLCSEYPHRGLICRLFGYSARTNKYDQRELVTCQIIKSEQSDAFIEIEKKISEGADVPVMSQYYMQLHAIDADMTRDFFPINKAIQRAIEEVLQYYSYRDENSL